jgi:hypothetical protein
MESTKRMLVCAFLAALLLVGSSNGARANYVVKNDSSKDIVLIPLLDVNVKVLVKVGDVVEVPPKYKDWSVKNLGNGAQSKPISLLDGIVIVVVDGLIEGTVKLLLGISLDGIISISADANVLVEV